MLAETDLPASAWVGARWVTRPPSWSPRPGRVLHRSETVGFHIGRRNPQTRDPNPGATPYARPGVGRRTRTWISQLAASPCSANYQAGRSLCPCSARALDESLHECVRPAAGGCGRSAPTGSPWDDDIAVGPVINEGAAARIETWVNDARDGGADRADWRNPRRNNRCADGAGGRSGRLGDQL